MKTNKKTTLLLLLLIIIFLCVWPRDDDSKVIKRIKNNALSSDESYRNLKYLCEEAPGRLVGSKASIRALEYLADYLEKLSVDTVIWQEYQSQAWESDSSGVEILIENNNIFLKSDALGTSPGTSSSGVIAEIIEVFSLKELEELGEGNIKGRVIFFNRPMEVMPENTFRGYGGAVDQRVHGPEEAAKYGAVGAIVRSVTTSQDDFPHTGSTNYEDIRIPAVAISTNSSDLLSMSLKENPGLRVKLFVDAKDIDQITTYNLIADLKGHEKPDEIIVVGGHIDSWFNSPGAHDDGIGCVQAIDVLRIFKDLGIKNKRTIRAVMFMDEELFQGGGEAYAEYVSKQGYTSYLALEADAGGFAPLGFTVGATENEFNIILGFKKYLEPFGIQYIKKGGGGVDIRPLERFNIPLIGYRTDSEYYFDLHHSGNDTFDKVDLKELQLGSGCMAALIYLIDKNGL